MVEKQQRLGRKNGKGFYDYPEKGPKKLWPGLAEMQPKKLDPDTIDVQEIKDRLLAMQALETARCFEEGVLTDVREADVGSILGFGFAPFSGGTLSYIDMMGVKRFVELCQRLEKKYGPRFAPAKLLLDMAKKGESFYRPLRARQEGGVTMQYSQERSVVAAGDACALVGCASLVQRAGAIVGAGLCRDRRRARPQRGRPADRPAPRSGEAAGLHRREERHDGARYGRRRRLQHRADGARGRAGRQGLWPGFREQRRAPRSASRRA